MADPYNLQRFIAAQGQTIEPIIDELRQGRKTSHWMWYVFPQIQGLGKSETAKFYAIQSREEAQAYLQHPILGPRLLMCTREVNAHHHLKANALFGHPDELKFRSCMTLFQTVAADPAPFTQALQQFFSGEPDLRTLSILKTL